MEAQIRIITPLGEFIGKSLETDSLSKLENDISLEIASLQFLTMVDKNDNQMILPKGILQNSIIIIENKNKHVITYHSQIFESQG